MTFRELWKLQGVCPNITIEISENVSEFNGNYRSFGKGDHVRHTKKLFENEKQKDAPVRHHGKNESYRKVMRKTQKTRPELSKANCGKFVTGIRFVSAFFQWILALMISAGHLTLTKGGSLV